MIDDPRPILDEIAVNQRAFNDAARSWKRFVPFWLFRRRYRLCKANEVLFAQIGVRFEPFLFETEEQSRRAVRMMRGV